MSSSRRPGRRVPPKGRLRTRSASEFDGVDDPAPGMTDGTEGAAETTRLRPGSRAANRAAKRAASGRPRGGAGGRGGRRRGQNNGLILLGIGALIIGIAVIAIGNPFGAPAASPSPAPSATPSLTVGDGTCPETQPAPLSTDETRTVTISTSAGDIVIKVDGGLSPMAAGNFVALATCHFYDGSVFHRTATMPDGTPFVIQGGAAKPGTGAIPYTILDEPVTATYKRGTVAMARTQERNSQTSQFFIVLDDDAVVPLQSANTYAIFGEVIAGMDVVDMIYLLSGGVENPSSPVVMTSVTVGPGPAPSATPAAPTATPDSATPEPTPDASGTPTTAP